MFVNGETSSQGNTLQLLRISEPYLLCNRGKIKSIKFSGRKWSFFPFYIKHCPGNAYNPRGNSQCEHYNSIIWNTILLALESQRLPINTWQDVLQDVLRSIPSLLCTTTNATPHESMFNFERRSSTLPVSLEKFYQNNLVAGANMT